MHLASCLLTILALGLSLCGASPAPSRHVVHESRSSIPTGWSPVRRADQDIVLPLRIGLVQPNIHKVEEYLMEVSHPQSPGYGKHWTPAEVGHAFRPSKEAVDVVRSWLLMSALGADRIRMTNDGTWIRVYVTVKEAEKLLGTEYYVYEKETEGEVIACADKYHLPEHVSGHVELVTPTLQFDFKHKRRAAEKRDRPPPSKLWRGIPTSNVSPASSAVAQVNGPVENITEQLSACGEQITPACLQLLYNFTDFTPQVPGNNSIAIVELTPNAYLASDLDMFFANFSPSQVGERPIFVSIDGGVVQTTTESLDDNVESDLDLQYAMALVGPTQNVTLLQAGDLVEGASPNDVLDALDASYCTYEGGDDPNLDPVYPDPDGGYQGKARTRHDCGTAPLPNVLSFSYSSAEAYFTPAYMERMCNEFAKLGLMGVTVLWSTGDYGVATFGDCLDAAGDLGSGTDYTTFSPSFPATCPYVTGVGATQINTTSTRTMESAAYEPGKLSSGGGFSNIFALPSYQQTVVQDYLTNYPPPYSSSVYNSSGNSRAYPDLSANGVRYTVAADGEWLSVYGTSASTPVIASFFTAINDARIAAGKSSIGFINPTIYSSSFQAAFNDITDGSNPGCGTQGFYAEPGWDPVTGIGTPNVAMLRDLWLELQ
ncbi:peptidase S8/S53 domain-containing protein [Rhodofomes roseus]|uniref:tripeptidyl-peptidase II n=1 Tax=Rhodofomes roseus TaxID=34475 RepID=A0ABQ8K4Y0_9APHY|nr:peptidase S8/S53 domain-containing protein [Rhodofomes roseus]KAH9831768.1 peptidase S8/S53 domain-containing protein [Rhodofomes roseus]